MSEIRMIFTDDDCQTFSPKLKEQRNLISTRNRKVKISEVERIVQRLGEKGSAEQ